MLNWIISTGQARRRRSPDEETPAAAPAAPAVAPVVAGLPFSYGALPYAAYPYAAYPYAQVKVRENLFDPDVLKGQ